MALAAAAPVALLTYLAPTSFLRGAIVGAGVVGIFAMLAVLVVQATGTAGMSQGASAEQLTASELRPLLAKGWRLINHTSLRQWDIDHVLVGPAGVVAVETKWSSHPWKLDPPSQGARDAIRQVGANARDLRLMLHLDHVRQAVFVWTPNVSGVTRPETSVGLGGADVVVGTRAARHWRDALQSAESTLTADQVDALWAKIDAHLLKRDLHDAETARVPATFARAYWTVLGSIFAFICAVLMSAYAYSLTRSWLVWGAVVAVQVAVGFARVRRLPRVARFAWLAGVFAMVAAALIDWLII